jgi:hypothetical protein
VPVSQDTSVLAGGAPGTAAAEAEWLSSAPIAPVQQRSAWPSAVAGGTWELVVARDMAGVLRGAVGLRSYPLRSLPGFRALRVLKFGHGLPAELVAPMLAAIRARAMTDRRIVRVNVEAFSVEPGGLAQVAEAAAACGFHAEPQPREYARTLLVDLRGGDDAMTGRFHRMVMKNVRRSERAGHVVAPITDVRYAPRMQALLAETMSRTGAQAQRYDWDGIIRAAREHPGTYRVAGLFMGSDRAPDSLVAYRWCACSGTVADDLLAASSRLSGPTGSVPMMPAIMLDVLRWAAGRGADWFDFGGIVEPDDPRYGTLGSITEFKRLFGSDVRTVGADFVYEARPLLSRVSRGLATLRYRLAGG